jgi:hypothetical protein
VAQAIEYLPSKHKTLSSNFRTTTVTTTTKKPNRRKSPSLGHTKIWILAHILVSNIYGGP